MNTQPTVADIQEIHKRALIDASYGNVFETNERVMQHRGILLNVIRDISKLPLYKWVDEQGYIEAPIEEGGMWVSPEEIEAIINRLK